MIEYFEVCDILKIHNKVLELSGGLEGYNVGNKRTSIAVGAYFLIENGYDEKITEYIRDMEDLVVEFVENKINREDFKEKLKKYVRNKKNRKETKWLKSQ